ncbi:MAG: toll/interleukin-1 receptor domain-containing protein [Anaerolineae bacterium]
MAQIFISYSKHNIDFARHLRAQLQGAGFEVWMDEIRLSTSQHWAETLESNITGCTIFMIILSPEAKSSQWVARELMLAERLNKPIFPILYKGDVWWNLANIQYEDMREGSGDAWNAWSNTWAQGQAGSRAAERARQAQQGDLGGSGVDETDSRRLEAAMPAETQAASDTEVWVKISLPDSLGLRGELPAAVPSGDVIQKGDARATTFPIRFPVDSQTGRRLPAPAELRVICGDFNIIAPGDHADVEIPAETDSRTVIFTLEPKPGGKTSGRTRVFVDLIYEMKIIAQISVSTQLVERVTAAVPAWNLNSTGALPPAGEALRGGAAAPLSLPELDDLDLSDETLDDMLITAEASPVALMDDFQTQPAEAQAVVGRRSRATSAALLRFASASAAILLVFFVVVMIGRNNASVPSTSNVNSVPPNATQINTDASAFDATEAVAAARADVTVAPFVNCTGTPGTSLVSLLQTSGLNASLLPEGINDQNVARSTPNTGVVVWGACSGDALWLYVELLNALGREALDAPPTITLIVPADTVERGDSYATRLVRAVTDYARGVSGEALVQTFDELVQTAMDEEDAAALRTLRDNSMSLEDLGPAATPFAEP